MQQCQGNRVLQVWTLHGMVALGASDTQKFFRSVYTLTNGKFAKNSIILVARIMKYLNYCDGRYTIANLK